METNNTVGDLEEIAEATGGQLAEIEYELWTDGAPLGEPPEDTPALGWCSYTEGGQGFLADMDATIGWTESASCRSLEPLPQEGGMSMSESIICLHMNHINALVEDHDESVTHFCDLCGAQSLSQMICEANAFVRGRPNRRRMASAVARQRQLALRPRRRENRFDPAARTWDPLCICRAPAAGPVPAFSWRRSRRERGSPPWRPRQETSGNETPPESPSLRWMSLVAARCSVPTRETTVPSAPARPVRPDR